MVSRKVAVVVFGALVLGTVLSVPTYGTEAALHTNYFTFSRAVAIPGAVLEPGSYIFERVDVTTPDVIVVRDRARTKVYFMGFTERIERPAAVVRRGATVTLGESRAGVPPPITAWYPVDSTRGHAFIYKSR